MPSILSMIPHDCVYSQWNGSGSGIDEMILEYTNMRQNFFDFGIKGLVPTCMCVGHSR